MPFKDKDALREYQVKWANENREKINAQKREKWPLYKERRNRERINLQRKARYKLNVEKHRQRAREYGAAHKDDRKRRSQEWYQANKARAREQTRANVARNPEKWREYYRQYHADNRERLAELARLWAANNPDKVRSYSHKACLNRRARKRRAFVEVVDPRVVFERDKGKCGICKRRVALMSKWHIDHIIPLAKCGAHSYDNVQLAHDKCNRSKAATLPKGQPTLFQVVPACG